MSVQTVAVNWHYHFFKNGTRTSEIAPMWLYIDSINKGTHSYIYIHEEAFRQLCERAWWLKASQLRDLNAFQEGKALFIF